MLRCGEEDAYIRSQPAPARVAPAFVPCAEGAAN
jgi:hypothetical protein